MTTLWCDIRYGVRMLRKNPGFTAVAVLTLALGIGATSTLFGVLEPLVLDPFPYPRSDRIAYIWSNPGQPLSMPDFKDIRAQNQSFAQIGVYTLQRFNLGLDHPVPAYAACCTAGVLRTFGMPPVLGRWLEEADEEPGAAPVTVISHSLWTRLRAADPDVLGRPIRLDGRETTVVGVMPADFEFQSPWYRGHDCELWVPLPGDNVWRGNHWLLGIGRLKDGVTVEAADAEIKTVGTRLAQAYPDSNLHKPFLVRSLWQQTTQNTASGTMLLLGAVLLLLLVACANVASLLLARGTERQGEFGVRLALGGGRRDVVRLLLSESLLLALLASGVGILLATWGLAVMQRLLPALLVIGARRAALHVNGAVLTFSAVLAVLTALLFGLLPAFTAARTPVVETLKGEGRSQTGSRLRHRFLRHLVTAQIAAAVVLGNGAILLFSSYVRVLQANRDLDTDQVVTADLSLRGDRYRQADVRQNFWQDLFDRVHTLPGVVSVAITSKMPLEGGSNSEILVDDEVYDPAIRRADAEQSSISPEYFAAMGIPLLRGRPPVSEDARGEVTGIAVNQTLANKYWPGQDPIGRRIRSNSAQPWFRAVVVGVVGDVRQWGAERPTIPEMYFPQALHNQGSMMLVVRTSGSAQAQIPLLRNVVAALDGDLPLANVRTMKEVVGQSTGPRRFLTQLVGLFMAATLVLAMVGIYGTLSYTVSQRQREIGVRMALGALRRDILRFVIRQAGVWILVGLALGSALTAALSFLLRSAAYGVNPLDPRLLCLGLVVVGSATAAACLLPTRRATRIDPMAALRHE